MNSNLIRSIGAVMALGTFVSVGVGPGGEARAASEKMSFAEDIVPILQGRCVTCHRPGGVGYDKSGFDLTSYEGLMRGTKFGPMVVPGDSELSNFMVLLDWRAAPELRMPHGQKKLSSCDRDAIRSWIREGAKNN